MSIFGGVRAFFKACLDGFEAQLEANIIRSIELIAIVVSISLDVSHLNHFTWWGLIWYGLYVISDIVNCAHRTWAAAVVTCTTVLGGVVVLSIFQCDMLTDALSEYGGSGYLLGNFLVHYWPCVRLYCYAPEQFDSSVGGKSLTDLTKEFWRQAALGFVPLLVYVSWTRTERVYGCSVPSTGVSAGTLLAPFAMVIVWWWRFYRKLK